MEGGVTGTLALCHRADVGAAAGEGTLILHPRTLCLAVVRVEAFSCGIERV